MRINAHIARVSNLSRRAADSAIADGRVSVNGQAPAAGQQVAPDDQIILDGHLLPELPEQPKNTLVMFNKPVGYVCSRSGQGSQTIYSLLPSSLQHLNPVGRLDKDSSGLLLLTNDGQLLQSLAHPSHNKSKLYVVNLDRPLSPQIIAKLARGVDIGEPRLSRIKIRPVDANNQRWEVELTEGRNRQIRRSFAAVGFKVIALHRISFGSYKLGDLAFGAHTILKHPA